MLTPEVEDSFLRQFWQVAVAAPLRGPLTYLSPLPSQLDGKKIDRGIRVTVPLGKRLAQGVVLGPCSEENIPNSENIILKSISSIENQFPNLPAAFMNWLEWLSHYYIYPLGMTMDLAYPPLKKAKEKKSIKIKVNRKAAVIPTQQLDKIKKPDLTTEQKACIDSITIDDQFRTHLVFGVTGSGKTEIYLRLLEKVLSQDKSALVLVPEISLTPQLVRRFVDRFGDKVAAIHSQLTEREKTDQWWDIVTGKKKILIGARSALFCPIEKLGIIIIDEEHEPSYKQDEKLKYHGRDAAIVLAKYSSCPIILGSATPSLESWKNALDGKYTLHTLKNRVENRTMPDFQLVDLRLEKEIQKQTPKKGASTFWLSPKLEENMREILDQENQVALFLNRRGLAQTIICPSCGHTMKCPNCEINLTLHANSHVICHYCDYHENFKLKCSDCKEGERIQIGIGTELLEQDLRKLFPDKKIARADRDEIQNRSDLEQLVKEMEDGTIDILIGTQMIAKGLDFPKLKLVGLILADVGFNLPDFRATERSFHLITQMGGRAGRHILPGESPGKVIIQCFNKEHASITFSQSHDFIGFAQNELATRESLGYPPFGKLISFRIQGPDIQTVKQTSSIIARRAEALRTQFHTFGEIEILGPCSAPLAKIRNSYRYHLLLKGKHSYLMNQFARQLLGNENWVPKRVKVLVDVDPLNLL